MRLTKVERGENIWRSVSRPRTIWRKGIVRSIDIAEELSVTKPSVSVAMKKLRTNGYIEMDEYGFISLKETGREIAERMYERHTLISKWLISMGVDPQVAVDDACEIEHVISVETFEAMKRHFGE